MKSILQLLQFLGTFTIWNEIWKTFSSKIRRRQFYLGRFYNVDRIVGHFSILMWLRLVLDRVHTQSRWQPCRWLRLVLDRVLTHSRRQPCRCRIPSLHRLSLIVPCAGNEIFDLGVRFSSLYGLVKCNVIFSSIYFPEYLICFLILLQD